jgi:hypothetical protein
MKTVRRLLARFALWLWNETKAEHVRKLGLKETPYKEGDR